MALLQLASLPVSFINMQLVERKSSTIATKSNNVTSPVECRASNKVYNNNQTILRRSANFQPSIWHYDYIESLSGEYKEELYKDQSKVLRDEVRMILCKAENHLHQLELIDVFQRLGVAYHFDDEIKKILENIYNIDTFKKTRNLYDTSLMFRVLRQNGFYPSTDVFDIFHDKMGNFKKCQYDDVEGILSLYEASFLSLVNEPVLDEARDFSSNFLKEYVNRNRDNHISLLINHALEIPFHWRVPRCETRWFIDVYEKRNNMIPALLKFAKLDFNMVQTIHQEELKDASRWWRRLGLVEKLDFCRDRLVESFFMGLGMDYKQDLGNFRRVITIVNSLVTTIDDIYDVHGTIEELELFTRVIDRWDLNAIESLPDYMKICFFALNKFVNEVAFETLKENGCHIIPYLRKAWIDLCKSYFLEAKWYHSGYTPRLGEYTANAWITISAPVVLVHAYFLAPNSFKKGNLFNLEEYPSLIRFSSLLSRLANDLGTSKRENETGDVPKSIECYMRETGASEEKAREHVKSMIYITWKKMNEEVRGSSFSHSFIDIAVNLARMALCLYRYTDGYTVQDPETNNRIRSLIMQPIPVIGPEIVVGK